MNKPKKIIKENIKTPKPAEKKVVKAQASFVHHSPRKLRLVADGVRNLGPSDAIAQLKILPQRAAGALLKVYLQAMANAKNNLSMSPGDLKVGRLMIEEAARGPKRADVHAHGARYDRGVRRKRMSHIKLELIVKE